MPSLDERFWAKVHKTHSCWFWIGSRNNKGYGQILIEVRDGKPIIRTAHQVSWELAYGVPFPTSKQTLHICDTRQCVRPDHLIPGSAKENAQDAIKKGVSFTSGVSQTHCKNGHEFNEENTYFYEFKTENRRMRICRICNRNRHKRDYDLRAKQ